MMRTVVTGMAVNTPLGDTPQALYEALIAGRSALTRWRGIDTSAILPQVGADLSGYDPAPKLAQLSGVLPPDMMKRLRRVMALSPFSTRLTVLCAADAWAHARLADVPAEAIAIVTGGHNFFPHYDYSVLRDFLDNPDAFDEQHAYKGLDTDQAAAVSEVLGITGPIYTLGGACASTNLALRAALDEVRHHGMAAALVVGPLYDYSPLSLQALALIGAITADRYADDPARASRPFDRDREGFVPAHGVGVMVIEPADAARARGADVQAEVISVTAGSGANRQPSVTADSEAQVMVRALREAGLAPDAVDVVSAHATSTPQGDLAELEAIRAVFGDHAQRLKINAPKSMLGHCCWSSAVVETIAGIMQMQHGTLHPTINLAQPDVTDLDLCADGPVAHRTRLMMKNAFGFGGINTVALLRPYDPEE